MKRIFLPLLILLPVLFSACDVMRPAIIEDSPVLETGQAYAEGLVHAFNTQDYSEYVQNFNSEMLASSSLTDFENLVRSLKTTMGLFESLDFLAIEEQNNLILIYYYIRCEDGDITMKLVLEPNEPYLISGLWFLDFNP